MGVVYQIMHALLRYVYGLFAAFMMYSPGAQGGGDAYSIIRSFLNNPCEIQNGFLGLLLLPSNAIVVGLVISVVGVGYLGYSIIQAFGRMFGETFSSVFSVVRGLVSTMRVGQWRHGRGRYGGYGGWEEGGYGEYGYGREGQAMWMSRVTTALALTLVGAILVAGYQSQSSAITQVVGAIGSLISGVFMVVVSGFVQVANTIIAASLGVPAVPICP